MKKVMLFIFLVSSFQGIASTPVDSLTQRLEESMGATERMEVLYQLSRKLVVGNIPLAKAYIQQGKTIAKGRSDLDYLTKFCYLTGYALHFEGNKTEAFREFLLAVKYGEEQAEKAVVCKAYEFLADYYFEANLFDEGVETIQKAIAYYKSTEEIWGLARTYDNLARNYDRISNYDLALPLFHKSIRNYQQRGDINRVCAGYDALANLFIHAYKPDSSRYYLLLAKDEIEKSQSVISLQVRTSIENNLHVIARMQRDYDSAFYFLRQAISLIAEEDSPLLKRNYYNNLGLLHLLTGNPEQALIALETARQVALVPTEAEFFRTYDLAVRAQRELDNLAVALDLEAERNAYENTRDSMLIRQTQSFQAAQLMAVRLELNLEEEEQRRAQQAQFWWWISGLGGGILLLLLGWFFLRMRRAQARARHEAALWPQIREGVDALEEALNGFR